MHELSLITEDIQRSQQRVSIETSNGFASQQKTLDQLLQHMYQLQEGQEHTNKTLQDLGNAIVTHRASTQSFGRNVFANKRGLGTSSDGTRIDYPYQGMPSRTISIKVRRLRGPSCLMCSCICHLRQQLETPPLLNRVIGSLFVGYTSVPVLMSRCNNPTCNRNSDASISATYMFPQWFWYRVLSMTLLYTRRDGLEFNIRMYRVDADYSPIFQYATTGNVSGMKALLRNGEASPFVIGKEVQMSPLIAS